jgi:hypothetical protein
MIWIAVGLVGASALTTAYFEMRPLWRKREQPTVRLLDSEERRIHQVEEAYVRGDIGDDDLEWCALLALCPPDPLPYFGVAGIEYEWIGGGAVIYGPGR